MYEPIIIVIIVSECYSENLILSMHIQVTYYSDVIIMCRNPLVKWNVQLKPEIESLLFYLRRYTRIYYYLIQ